ncbi:DUF3757 domain-containing protein [Legionella taurinensis]|uniref:DUF3757 domain-containing protein n=1 Tax=Legionella taurinensis TaxID=70611 RepID=A0A3A5L9H2_9GAMM|nr:hypothetical protein DB744_09880 [Legionella taurinensis]PUT41749.1 hypothetical protein DB746_08795 [Legionella taurinensis]PUT44583.1 hypothetical protein DB743_08010 [Legionella taurinensis]PUT46827.1 hypothetical protein DB745_09875 [Legionella taurinensis]RJT47740.1 DUF3757 domain-containing protein [Legionella taurinensis]
MKKTLVLTACCLMACTGYAAITTCPDPNTTSLQWGEPPAPWVVNPYSPHIPQGEANTAFVRANLLVAGLGRGVVCTYKNSLGEYSIWWQVLVKIPSRNDYRWIDTLGGFVCTQSLTDCEFSAAS